MLKEGVPVRDDLGTPVDLPSPPRRVVSLVPSLTEALAVDHREQLVGATDWCTHPADLDVARVRGTKNPNLRRIRELQPDLVIANKEENRELDVRRLRDSGVTVWVTEIETLDEAFTSMRRLWTEALQAPVPGWLLEAENVWSQPAPHSGRAVITCVWRDPWMVVGRDTFTGDMLKRLGLVHVFADHSDRYPAMGIDDLDDAGADLVLLPDEPYVFTAEDGPEALRQTATALCRGRALTWYGPALVSARTHLDSILAASFR